MESLSQDKSSVMKINIQIWKQKVQSKINMVNDDKTFDVKHDTGHIQHVKIECKVVSGDSGEKWRVKVQVKAKRDLLLREVLCKIMPAIYRRIQYTEKQSYTK